MTASAAAFAAATVAAHASSFSGSSLGSALAAARTDVHDSSASGFSTAAGGGVVVGGVVAVAAGYAGVPLDVDLARHGSRGAGVGGGVEGGDDRGFAWTTGYAAVPLAVGSRGGVAVLGGVLVVHLDGALGSRAGVVALGGGVLAVGLDGAVDGAAVRGIGDFESRAGYAGVPVVVRSWGGDGGPPRNGVENENGFGSPVGTGARDLATAGTTRGTTVGATLGGRVRGIAGGGSGGAGWTARVSVVV